MKLRPDDLPDTIGYQAFAAFTQIGAQSTGANGWGQFCRPDGCAMTAELDVRQQISPSGSGQMSNTR